MREYEDITTLSDTHSHVIATSAKREYVPLCETPLTGCASNAKAENIAKEEINPFTDVTFIDKCPGVLAAGEHLLDFTANKDVLSCRYCGCTVREFSREKIVKLPPGYVYVPYPDDELQSGLVTITEEKAKSSFLEGMKKRITKAFKMFLP